MAGQSFVEKRSHPRVPIHFPLKYRLLDGQAQTGTISEMRKREVTAKAIDASLGGMFIAAEESLDVGGVMALHFSVPETPGELSAFAEVVWSNTSGVGVHFLALKPEDLKTLDVALARATFA